MKRPSGVAADRVLALGSILSGTFLMVVVLAVPKGAVVVAILAASLVTLIVVALRLIHHTRRGALHEQVRLSARLPSLERQRPFWHMAPSSALSTTTSSIRRLRPTVARFPDCLPPTKRLITRIRRRRIPPRRP
jgi:hypothetical protein